MITAAFVFFIGLVVLYVVAYGLSFFLPEKGMYDHSGTVPEYIGHSYYHEVSKVDVHLHLNCRLVLIGFNVQFSRERASFVVNLGPASFAVSYIWRTDYQCIVCLDTGRVYSNQNVSGVKCSYCN